MKKYTITEKEWNEMQSIIKGLQIKIAKQEGVIEGLKQTCSLTNAGETCDHNWQPHEFEPMSEHDRCTKCGSVR